MTDRAAFLTRLGEALDRRPRDPVPRAPLLAEALVRRVAAGSLLVDRFLAEVAAAGGETARAPIAELASITAARLATLGIHHAILDADAERLGMREACDRAGIVLVPLAEAPEAAAGITGVVAAVAETGTVVLDAAPGTPRGTSLLPTTHVAIVLEEQILPDLIDALRLPGEMPSSRVWVTGPSKTADIEGVLVTGVHGPARWIVVVGTGSG